MLPVEVLRLALQSIGKERIGGDRGRSGGLQVLDACAAPGSKATQLCAWLEFDSRMLDGVVVANEPDKERAAKLYRNFLRMGFADVLVTCLDGRALGELVPEQFDAVLVDAPCSCEGNARKDPFALLRVGQEDEVVLGKTANGHVSIADLQWELIKSCWRTLRPGGCLVYSTCTFNRIENEAQCERLLKATQESGNEECMTSSQHLGRCRARIMDVSSLLGLPSMPEARDPRHLRFWPHVFDAEGFFVACFFKEPLSASFPLPLRLPERQTARDLKMLPPAEAARLRTYTEQQLGFWFESGALAAHGRDAEERLYKNSDGEVWLVPRPGFGLDPLLPHTLTPGLLVARPRHWASTDCSPRELSDLAEEFDLSSELLFLAGDRAKCVPTQGLALDKWAMLSSHVHVEVRS